MFLSDLVTTVNVGMTYVLKIKDNYYWFGEVLLL